MDIPDLFRLLNFLFFLGMDIASLVIAIKGYKNSDLKRTWLFLILVISIGLFSYLISWLFFNPFTMDLFDTQVYLNLANIFSYISTFFSFIRSILFLLMLIWLYRKK